MQEVKVKTHLIVTDVHNEYDVDWCGKLKDAHPIFKKEKPIFILISSDKRVELNTWDMAEIERVGKLITKPKGRQAVAEDETRVYLAEENDKKRLMCVITHRRVKTFAPMYDSMWWRD